MKALSLWQPWAQGMRDGVKMVETRHWLTKHRGLLAIHAAKRTDRQSERYVSGREYPEGAVLGVVSLQACIEMDAAYIDSVSLEERSWGHWDLGRFAWVTSPVLWFTEPIPAIGRQGLFEWRPQPPLEAVIMAAARRGASCQA